MDHLPSGIIPGFERRRLVGEGGVIIDTLVGGSGPPLLLLHGYPQTRMAFAQIAPELARSFTVVVPDLRGYGRSEKPQHEEVDCYSKRTMARDQLAVMAALGFERFSLAGHDRGGRVAYRLALDHPEAVDKLVLLDILPTHVMWERANAQSAMRSYHWYFLAQPAPFPENMIGLDPDYFTQSKLKGWAGEGFRFAEESYADYLACMRDPATIHAACEDYRAGWTLDYQQDLQDRGVRSITSPVLLLWGADYGLARSDLIATWREWAADVQGYEVPGGHFICEESPEVVLGHLTSFLGEPVGDINSFVG